MFKYKQFDLINKTKKSKLLKIILNILIIGIIVLILLLNINTKDDVKIISSNSRRIINTLNNYTETMSDFMISNTDLNDDIQLYEIKKIRMSIDYLKELKEEEIKEKEKELQQLQIRQEKIKQEELKQKAYNLIKSYIPNYNSIINLVSSHLKLNGYSNDFNCLKEKIRINNQELFNNLIKIDYDKLEVSFNYLDENEDYYKNTDNIITSHLYTDYDENNRYYNYSHYLYRNYKENIIKNPIYQIIKSNLEIDYSYTEPNLTDEYNNKSKYFQKSLNDFKQIQYDYHYQHWDKYYENYENDTSYLYYRTNQDRYDYYGNIISSSYFYKEFLIKNKINIYNPNPIDIYTKHPYKFICNIPSKTMNNTPLIKNDYSIARSYYGNWCYGRLSDCIYSINKNNIEETLNIDLNDYLKGFNYYYNDGSGYTLYPFNSNYYYVSSNINYELYKNTGTRMIKHNLTNNFPEYLRGGSDSVEIQNYYFIEKVFIDFPIIFIYDEYEYIKLLISGLADIYNLPIIPPIKF